MLVIDRKLHSTDVALSSREARRTIGNYINFQKPNGVWRPSNDEVPLAPYSSSPEDWDGTFDIANFRDGGGPIEMFAVERSDGAAICGMRLSSQPKIWVKYIPLDAVLGVTPLYVDARTLTWTDLWTSTDLTWRSGRHKISKLITLKDSAAPTVFRFRLKLAAGLTAILDEALDIIRIVSRITGEEVFRTKPTSGIDASGKKIRVNLRGDGVDVDGTLRFRVVANSTDMATAEYPVELDPTTNISGTTALEDTILAQATPNNNFGANVGAFCGFTTGSTLYRELFRLTSSASIPGGVITGLTVNMYQGALAGSQNAGTGKIFLVKDGDVWVEGTQTGAAETGSSCWNKKVYNTTNWAGSIGCGTADTDYYATDGTYTATAFTIFAKTSGGRVLRTYSLPPVFATHWRDGVRTRNGIIFRSDSEAATNTIMFWDSTEAASNTPSVDITYLLGTPLLFFTRR